MLLRQLALSSLALLAIHLAPAHADTKSWTALKSTAHEAGMVALSFDIAAIRKLPAYPQALAMVLAEARDVKEGFDLVKALCDVDVAAIVSDVSVVMNKEERTGLFVIGLDGADRPATEACLQKMAARKNLKLATKTTGKITEYTAAKDTIHVAWLAKDVVAVMMDAENRAALEKAVSGKGLKGELGDLVGKARTSSPIWFAVAKKERMSSAGTMTGVYGMVDIAGGMITGVGRIVMSSATEATSVVKEGKAELPRAVKRAKDLKAAELAKVLGALKVAANGAEIEITGSVTDKQLVPVLQSFEKVF